MAPLEPRHRPAGAAEDTPKRRASKIKSFKDVENFEVLVIGKNCACKFKSLRILIVAIISATVLTLLTPTLYEFQLQSASRYVDVGWMWDRTSSDPRYVSSVDVQWDDVSRALNDLHGGGANRALRIGLLNFNSTEYGSWTRHFPGSHVSVARLEPANPSVTWQTLYPEWIDEEEENEVPTCPSLPEPSVRRGGVQFDVVAVKLPCARVAGWSRDVARLHLQLAAARLAVSSASEQKKRNGKEEVHVLFVTECFPVPNLFPCKNLVKREGDVWVYRPDLKALREKLELPVGSCQLAVPLNAKSRLFSVDRRREAYATILHSASEYVCGAITAAQSIRQAGSTRDLVILVDDTISADHRHGLESAGWEVRVIERIRNPKAARDAYNEWNYSKFRLWQLTDYDRVVFIDADLLVLRNVDFLFAAPEIAATGNNATLFNSGVMVIEPSNCTFALLMDHIHDITSYNGGDQGYLNEVFTWWHRVPRRMNFLKHFWEGDSAETRARKTSLFAADPPALYVLHYLGLKPWLCFRDYDCNWNNAGMRGFASDAAHVRWWKVHDAMPRGLQRYCLLRSRQKAALEWDRRQAQKANFSDGHWRRNITDARLKECFEKFCFWESMLWHWGEKNKGVNKRGSGTGTPSLASS